MSRTFAECLICIEFSFYAQGITPSLSVVIKFMLKSLELLTNFVFSIHLE